MFWLSRWTYSGVPGLGPAAVAAGGRRRTNANARSALPSRCPRLTGTPLYPSSRMSEKVGRLAELHLGNRGLPRGPHSLPAAQVRLVQRERLVRAALSTVADLGYAPTTVREVVRRAGVSLKAFYEHFDDKQDSVLSAIGESMDVLPRHLDAEDGLETVFRRPLEFFAAEPEVARAFHLELRAAGPEGRALYFAVLRVFANVIREWHEREWPEAAAQAGPELY